LKGKFSGMKMWVEVEVETGAGAEVMREGVDTITIAGVRAIDIMWAEVEVERVGGREEDIETEAIAEMGEERKKKAGIAIEAGAEIETERGTRAGAGAGAEVMREGVDTITIAAVLAM
jgi:hypothetical protein